ncbi:non-muscle cofilin 1-like [Sphaeramia orbicularis]|uniref:Cofilin-2-like n=1 Tax=Sphaeramia orbicularis TaxID=375764 RepID=A0A673BD36_9TELE|nr:cofilin-2-like [Sphaeramia orbicularis]
MSSGVAVSDEVKDLFNEMKVQKSGDDQRERLRIVTFVIDGDFVQAEEKYRQKDVEDKDDIYKFFLSVLKEKSCRYVLYDCHFETKESKKEELVFGMWNPDHATVKDRLLYSSTKTAVGKAFSGVKHNIAINGYAEIEDKDSFADKLGKNIVSLEGHSM